MTCRAKAIVTLAVIAPLLTEIDSGNTPAHALLHPCILIFLIGAYSLPLLVIREASLRWKLGLAGLFCLGLAYGILNEGLIAQTLLRRQGVPISNFDYYAYAHGINFSWASVIVPWHALMAVIFPLALIHAYFPDCRSSPWLGRNAFAMAGVILASGVAFLSIMRQPHIQMRGFLIAIFVLVALAWSFRGPQGKEQPLIRLAAAFVAGVVFYGVFFLGAIVLATVRVKEILFFPAVGLMLAGFAWLCRRYQLERHRNAANVALGSYFAASLFHFAGGIEHRSIEETVVGALLACVFAWLARKPMKVLEQPN